MQMFEPSEKPRLFALPSGTDFPAELLQGLRTRLIGQAPEAMASVELIVNTRRMARRFRDLFDAGPACLLPRITLLSDIADRPQLADLRPAVPGLRRRLELVRLIGELLERQPGLAARSSLYDLADSLANLMSEMHGEGVSADKIRALDVSDLSGHWARAQAFIGIADQFLTEFGADPDAEARQRIAVEKLARVWTQTPPKHPVILAGSTGSRGTTSMLMSIVASLPQGAVVLPGFDFDLPNSVWERLDDPLLGEDHPQFRFRVLTNALGVEIREVGRWTERPAPSLTRNKVLSLALRPAPVTDTWLTEGPDLPDLPEAMADVTLVEAGSPRLEALAIALQLRQAAEDGRTAALITPDRMLTRQVSAALDRWQIVPDDSAGQPLHLSPPGRLLRHVAELFVTRVTGESLLTLLKHPICHSGADRGEHLRRSRDLELHLRKHGPPYPDAASCASYGAAAGVSPDWITWITTSFTNQAVTGTLALSDWTRLLRSLAEQISAGSSAGIVGELWLQNAGQAALKVIEELEQESPAGGEMTARDFGDLLSALLSGQEVRDRDAPSGSIMIWGTLEARVQGADLLILGGLNEGSWPEATKADPWLNRALRHQAGLLLPDRRIGLSAHDFQQAAAAPQVCLTRAFRSDDAETVASRWLNRLTNLLAGLPVRQGPLALEQMRGRGAKWLQWADALDQAPRVAPAVRPSPRPPSQARPRVLSVTEIRRLIRDPYAVYARRILRLYPLDPLLQAPDALLRGIVVHKVLERFVGQQPLHQMTNPKATFQQLAHDTLDEDVPWPIARKLWSARLDRIADWFLAGEAARQSLATPQHFEVQGQARLDALGVTLKGVADRIDVAENGKLRIYDYKTGTPPTQPQQVQFDKQLLLEAALATKGAFAGIGQTQIEAAEFIGLGGTPKVVSAPLDESPPDQVWMELEQLIAAYLSETQGFTARRMLFKDSEAGDYDHLARFGEWDRATPPTPEVLR